MGRELIGRPPETAVARAGSRRSSHPTQRSPFRSNALREKRPFLQVDVKTHSMYVFLLTIKFLLIRFTQSP